MLRGADDAVVRRAIEQEDPFPGTFGFAGELEDGRLVRDVLGRVPIYIEESANTTHDSWAFDPDVLSDPAPFPPGSVRDGESIRRVWELPETEPLAPTDAFEALTEAMDRAVAAVSSTEEANSSGDADGGGDKVAQTALAFSGGVDSALIAGRFDVPLYSVGFPGSHDVTAARETAAMLDRPLRVVELDLEQLERLVPRVARAIGRTNAMDVQIAIPLFCVAKAASRDEYSRLLVGQGADELFGGYEKVESAQSDPRVDASTVRGARDEVLAGLPRQIERDVRAIRGAGVAPVSPFLHDAVVHAALRLPTSELVAPGTRKVALRRLAAQTLPDSIADRPKKAMQYGTDVSRELDRLARQAGFKRRMDDHVGQYIAARVEAADSTDPA